MSVFLVDQSRPYTTRGGAPALPNFGGSVLFRHIPLVAELFAVLKVVQERSRVSPAIRGRVPIPRIFKFIFDLKMASFSDPGDSAPLQALTI